MGSTPEIQIDCGVGQSIGPHQTGLGKGPEGLDAVEVVLALDELIGAVFVTVIPVKTKERAMKWLAILLVMAVIFMAGCSGEDGLLSCD